jgi:hypothetical protein
VSARPQRAVRWRGIIALGVAAVVAAGIGQTSAGHSMLGKLGLFKEPTSYTSLAFLHPQTLAEQLSARPAKADVAFVIQNHGATAHDYQWSLRLVHDGSSHRLAAGHVRVGSMHQAAIARSAKILCRRGQVIISVTLASPAEFIDASTTCSSHGS